MKNKTMTALAAAALAAVALTSCAQMNREQHDGCTVEDKDRAIDSGGSPSYRVYTDCGVFTVEDNLLEGQFDSADVYAGLELGALYEFETIGWRNGFLSLFPIIVAAEKSE